MAQEIGFTVSSTCVAHSRLLGAFAWFGFKRSKVPEGNLLHTIQYNCSVTFQPCPSSLAPVDTLWLSGKDSIVQQRLFFSYGVRKK